MLFCYRLAVPVEQTGLNEKAPSETTNYYAGRHNPVFCLPGQTGKGTGKR
jgi:hypothetical protein